ncbi:ubiquinone biosynthesis accessory factor UbiJ [Endozoicomonas arenosclerae]|uniref:ubiquinone biosynthesis accessory factor UbiJ n=1 Tax=Endozoicomonas arenosclerae TaxID=1633495 RepID=UPI00078246D0|nr:SCP2 sterol-binding domain-containing protein [Endozoicomonas arenosclerae]
MMKTAFLAFLETRINQLLKLDPVTIEALRSLDGSVIHFNCLQPEFQCYVFLDALGVRCAGWHEGSVDVTFQGGASSFIELSADRVSAWDSIKGLNVSGDPEVIAALESAHRKMELDWESLICERIGPVAGHTLVEGMRLIASTFVGAGESLSAQGAVYLQDELKVIPSEPELSAFSREVDALRGSVEHLDERLNKS